jgi:hypothetical protein
MQSTPNNILSGHGFEQIPLEQATKVRMMNRIDKKYWFHVSELPGLFAAIKNDYLVQTIEGRESQQYATQYFDTVDNKMYTLHHNGKLNRYKIRHRDYVDSDDHFLEVKFKNNKGRTIKKRVESTSTLTDFNKEESEFLRKRTIFGDEQLGLSLKNQFTRLTLISKSFTERCTIDVDIRFMGLNKSIAMGDLVILELKSEKGNKSSPLKRYLRDARLKSSGFSKYCIGRVLTDPKIKRNRFKQKIRAIGKMLERPDLYNI